MKATVMKKNSIHTYVYYAKKKAITVQVIESKHAIHLLVSAHFK